MKLYFKPHMLELKHVFTVAASSRTSTPIVLTQIIHEGVTSYGEASMPPYLGEDTQSVLRFLSKVNLEQFSDPFCVDDILAYVDALEPGNTAAKASVDIALHDLIGKLIGQPLHRIWGYNPQQSPYTSYTIGIDSSDVVIAKTLEASSYNILKVKLGRDNDAEMVQAIRSVSDKPLYVDANQGWKDKGKALEMVHWLKEQGALLVEQPMPKEQLDDIAWLTQHSPLPIIADEGIKRLADLVQLHGAYSGVNVKLMKSTGLREAHRMISFAKAIGMKTMIGCMTETSCAISAAAHLSIVTDFTDLDGALLISNDAFDGATVVDGKVTLNDRPGIGVTCR
jgi:L-Ala-D/L-Glu epimerase